MTTHTYVERQGLTRRVGHPELELQRASGPPTPCCFRRSTSRHGLQVDGFDHRCQWLRRSRKPWHPSISLSPRILSNAVDVRKRAYRHAAAVRREGTLHVYNLDLPTARAETTTWIDEINHIATNIESEQISDSKHTTAGTIRHKTLDWLGCSEGLTQACAQSGRRSQPVLVQHKDRSDCVMEVRRLPKIAPKWEPSAHWKGIATVKDAMGAKLGEAADIEILPTGLKELVLLQGLAAQGAHHIEDEGVQMESECTEKKAAGLRCAAQRAAPGARARLGRACDFCACGEPTAVGARGCGLRAVGLRRLGAE